MVHLVFYVLFLPIISAISMRFYVVIQHGIGPHFVLFSLPAKLLRSEITSFVLKTVSLCSLVVCRTVAIVF